jgi:hypothetical protein
MAAFTKGPTMDQLHAAWLRRNKRGPLWPPTFEEAMEHPLLMRILKIRALHLDLRAAIKASERRHPSDPVTLQVTKPHREPDRAAYWMDSKDPDD